MFLVFTARRDSELNNDIIVRFDDYVLSFFDDLFVDDIYNMDQLEGSFELFQDGANLLLSEKSVRLSNSLH
jgi:hypothetical protein